jgi:hypothetical protein
MKKICFLVLAIGAAAAGLAMAAGRVPLQARANGAARSATFLTSDVDLYCSFFVPEALPTLKIVGGENSRTLFSDGDIVFFKGNGKDVPAEGQVMAVLELGPQISGIGKKPSPGPLVFQRGRVRVLRIENGLASGRVEKACGPLMTGHFLVPFLEKEKVTVKDAGFEGQRWTGGALSGHVLFLEDTAVQIATGQRALIDLGRADGLELGKQLTAFVRGDKEQSYEPLASLVVIDIGKSTATVKVLSAKAPIRVGDVAQIK